MSEIAYEAYLTGLPVEQQLDFYKDLYDETIQITDYLKHIDNSWSGVLHMPCPIHDEAITGNSFSIVTEYNLWTCFGSCQSRGHGHGRVVYLHYLLTRKYNPNFTIHQALKSLYNMFHQTPTDMKGNIIVDYVNLPYPKIYKNSGVLTDIKSMQTEINIPESITINPEDIKLITHKDLSNQVLALFLTKPNTAKHYKKR